MPKTDEKYAFFLLGNTCETIPENEATWDKEKKCKKIYQWTVYLDVVEGNRQVISQVKGIMLFGKGRSWTKIENCPQQVTTEDGKTRWRLFQSKQSTYRPTRIKFEITGIGGTILKSTEYVTRPHNYEESDVHHFFEPKPAIPNIKNHKELSPELSFRLKFVAASSQFNRDTMPSLIVCGDEVSGESGVEWYKRLVQEHEETLSNTEFWPLVQVNLPEVAMYNDTFLLQSLTKICQNSIKYESAIDSFFNPRVFKSNKEAVKGIKNKSKHNRLASCKNIQDLFNTMTPEYSERKMYKFNILNSGKTVEFCFGSANPGGGSILLPNLTEFLIRFVINFVDNTIRLRSPNNLKDNRTVAEAKDCLFQHVIKDGYVERSLGSLFSTGLVAANDEVSVAKNQCCPSLDCMDVMSLPDFWEEEGIEAAMCRSGHLDLDKKRKRERTNHKRKDLSSIIHDESRKRRESLIMSQQQQLLFDTNVNTLSPSISSYGEDHSTHDEKKEPPQRLLLEMIERKEKILTFRLLKGILRKLNVSLRNQRPLLLEKALAYFDARKQELSHYLLSSGVRNNKDCLLGIQLVRNNDSVERYEEITMFLSGGRKLFRSSCSAEAPKVEEIQCVQAGYSDLCEVLAFLQREPGRDLNSCIASLDDFLSEVFVPNGGDDKDQSYCSAERDKEFLATRFAIIYDKPV